MKMKHAILAVSAIAVLAALAALPFLFAEPAVGVQAQVDKHIGDVMDHMGTRAVTDPTSAMSSNPYEYTNDPAFGRLVSLGTTALPVIEQEIADSQDNGLREYMLAIAAERIAKVDLKRDGTGWQDGKQWRTRWRDHLGRVPAEVDAIAAADLPADEKGRRLAKLGTPAIPYVMDNIEAGHEELNPAVKDLVTGTREVPRAPGNVSRSWVTSNKHRFDDMRALVRRSER